MGQRNGHPQKGTMGGRAVDLAITSMSDDDAREAQELIELKRGARCSGCGRRITIGFQFVSVDPRDPDRPVMEMAACTRDDCGFAEDAKDGATWMVMVEFAWTDANGSDAPAAGAIVRRNKAREAKAAARAEAERRSPGSTLPDTSG